MPLRSARVAVIKDGGSLIIDKIGARIRREVGVVVEGRAELNYRDIGGATGSEWSSELLRTHFLAALNEPEVDMIFVVGLRSTALAASPEIVLTKPVFGAVIQDTDLMLLPIGADGRSTKANFSVVSLQSRAADQLAMLREAVPFKSLDVIFDDAYAPDAAAIAAWRSRLASSLGVSVKLVCSGNSSLAVLSDLGDKAEAVLLMPMLRMSPPEYNGLLQGLHARRLPTMSFIGQSEVEAGVLAGVLSEGASAIARRMAINVDQYLAGTPIADLPLRIPARTEVFFNETTAAAIGFAARFDALNNATLVSSYVANKGESLSLAGAVALALDQNFDLRARKESTVASAQDVEGAKGLLMPQVAAVANAQQIDGDRARASGGLFPEQTVFAGLAATQVIYDDEASTRVKMAREALRAANHVERVQKMDTANAAMQAYLQYLSAQAALRVSEQNAKVIRKNLELSQVRRRVGFSGPEDILRFESLAAQQRSELIAARSQVNKALVALNRVLGVDVSTPWKAADISFEDPAFQASTGCVVRLIRDRDHLDRFRSFLTSYALDHSPDLAAYGQGIEVQKLGAAQKGRRDYLPKVTASVNYGRLLHQNYGGPTFVEQLAGAGLPVRPEPLDRIVWTAGVQATVPLFTGGAMSADTRKARAQLRQMELTRDGLREAVSAQTQALTYSIESSYSNIELFRQAADLAAKNLEVTQQKYEQGTLSIVTLLDAQTTVFNSRQAADVAVYRFFGDIASVQRTIGWIEAFATAEEKSEWLRRAESFVKP